MRVLTTILLLPAVVLVICVPYFVGHGLAVESSRWIVAGLVCGVVAAALIFTIARVLRPRAVEHGSHA